MRDHHRACFSEKNSKAQRCVSWMFLRLGSWHIFLFSVAYFLSYWHISLRVSIIRQPNQRSISKYNFYFPSCNITSEDFGFFSRKDSRWRSQYFTDKGQATVLLVKHLGHMSLTCYCKRSVIKIRHECGISNFSANFGQKKI